MMRKNSKTSLKARCFGVVCARWVLLVLLLLSGACINEPAPLKSSYLDDLVIYSDQELKQFKPLMTRYNLDPPLSGDRTGIAAEEEPDLFKPHHKFSKMRYMHDDGTISVHHYMEAGTAYLVANLLSGHVKGLTYLIGDSGLGVPGLGANEITVFPDFIMDARKTTDMSSVKDGFHRYGKKPRAACDLLVVRAGPDKLLEAEEYIARLLTEIPQIEIKVRIIEVMLQDTFEYGVDQLIYKDTTGQSFLNTIFETDEDGNFIRDDNGNLIYESGGWSTKFNTESMTIQGLDDFRGSIFHVGGVHDSYVLDAFIEILQRTTDSQVLIAPKIMVLNGHKAVIETGVDVPVQQVITQTTQTTFKYNYQSTGVRLVILPTLLMDDTILIQVNGEVTSISGEQVVDSTEGPISIPIFSTRNISDVVRVREGEAFAMGGLIANVEIKRVSKVPLLGDIPIIGFLFKGMLTATRKTQIIFYIEPHIVRPEETIYMPE